MGRIVIVCSALAVALACQPTEHKVGPPPPPAAPVPQAAPEDAPNANAARYGPHGVAQTPSPVAAAPANPEPGERAAAPALPVAANEGADEAGDGDMRGHPCHCGKTCHCGHCSGAVPGCHCHVKRADDK